MFNARNAQKEPLTASKIRLGRNFLTGNKTDGGFCSGQHEWILLYKQTAVRSVNVNLSNFQSSIKTCRQESDIGILSSSRSLYSYVLRYLMEIKLGGYRFKEIVHKIYRHLHSNSNICLNVFSSLTFQLHLYAV